MPGEAQNAQRDTPEVKRAKQVETKDNRTVGQAGIQKKTQGIVAFENS
jgi:hypothetical protein